MNNSNKSEMWRYKYRHYNLNPLVFYACGYGRLGRVSGSLPKRGFWRLCIVFEKGLSIKCGDTGLELNETLGMLIPPNTFATREFEHSVEHFSLHFNLGVPYDFLRGEVFSFGVTDQMRRSLDVLTTCLVNSSDDHLVNPVFALNIQSLVFECLCQIPTEMWPKTPSDSRIASVVQIIEKDLKGGKKNQDLARVATMSVNAFIRLFTRLIGVSPQAYAMERRLQKAATKLVHSDQTIDEIALQYGFCDRGHFSREFKKHYRKGPGLYRKRSRNEV